MTLPPPLLTSTPVRREAFQPQTAVETCRSETRQHAEVRSLASHESVVIKTQTDRLSNSQRVLRTVFDATRSDRQNDRGLDDYRDLWSTATPSRHLVSAAQPLNVAAAAAYTYRTMPSMSRRGPCRLDPAKYQLPVLGEAATADVGGGDEARRSSPSVFRFDASRPPLSRRLDARTHDTEPSPIYAEPCDRLADGLRQRVAGRRGRVPPTTDTVTVATPPISAGYKQPRDFLDLASASTRDIQPPASIPDGRSAARSPQVVVTAPSTIDDDEDVAAASTVEPGPFPDSADGRGSRSRFRHDNRLKISAAAAAVRRQRRSNYDNIDDDEDRNNDDDGGHASRCTTVSSARTEYSPPWDADRWRHIVDAADLELCMRGDVMNSAAAMTGASEQPEQRQVSQLLNCVGVKERSHQKGAKKVARKLRENSCFLWRGSSFNLARATVIGNCKK